MSAQSSPDHDADAPLTPLFVYAYDDLDGVPLWSMSPEDVIDVTDAAAREVWRQHNCFVLLGDEDAETSIPFGAVFRQERRRRLGSVRVLMVRDAEWPALWRDDLVGLLSPSIGRLIRQDYAETPWISMVDAMAWCHYEDELGLLFLFTGIDERFRQHRTPRRCVFPLMQMLSQSLQRNAAEGRRRYRHAFRKALPTLLPGMTIAKKKPGYAHGKGRADLFLAHQRDLLPTRLCWQGATAWDVTNLQQAMQGYKAPAGVLVAPTLEDGVVIEAPLRFVPFEGGPNREET